MSSSICPNCGHPHEEGARFCGSCGASLLLEQDPRAYRLLGRVLDGRYEVRRVIAEGGMGIVYEAEQRMGSHLRKVAIKTLQPDLSHDAAVVSRFYRECGTVAQLEHPNTIKVYDFGKTDDGELFIVMEYVRGEALSDLIERGALPLDRALSILRQICGALHEAHETGVVHRDLKPDNIILTTRAGQADFVKLLDFGIAARSGRAATRVQTKLTQQGMVLGTPPYMSPEQLAGSDIDRRSDLYSLGVIAYEMLAGHRPFEASSPWQWAHKHMTEPVPPLPPGLSLPSHVERAVRRALAKNRDDRPATALDFFKEISGEGAITAVDLAPTLAPTSELTEAGTVLSVRSPVSSGTEQRPLAAIDPRASLPPRPRRRGGWRLLGSLLTIGVLAAGSVLAIRSYEPTGPAPEQPLVGSATPEATTIEPLSGVERVSDDAIADADAGREPVRAIEEPQVEPKPKPKPKASPKPPKPATEAPKPAPTPSAPSTPSAPPVATLPTLPLPLPFPVPAAPAPQPAPAPAPTATPAPAPGPTATPSPPAPAGPVGDAACRQASAQARSGSIEAAAASLRLCAQTGGGAGAQRSARAMIETQAPAEVRRRAFRQNCDGARSAAQAAASVGAGDRAMSELRATSCG